MIHLLRGRRRVQVQVQQRRDGVRLRRRRGGGPVGGWLRGDGRRPGAVHDAAVCQIPATATEVFVGVLDLKQDAM